MTESTWDQTNISISSGYPAGVTFSDASQSLDSIPGLDCQEITYELWYGDDVISSTVNPSEFFIIIIAGQRSLSISDSVTPGQYTLKVRNTLETGQEVFSDDLSILVSDPCDSSSFGELNAQNL